MPNDLRLSTPAGFRLVAQNPRVTQDQERLQFDLAVETEAGAVLFVYRNWSVYRGRLGPPARPAGRAWIPTATWGPTPSPRQYLRDLLKPWQAFYPQIEFDLPKTELKGNV